MKKVMFLTLIMTAGLIYAGDGGYKVGDVAADFNLKNVDGKMVSMANYPDAKGFIVVFTCNHCPYAKAYENRLIELDKMYSKKGYPVIAINPNDPNIVPEDSYLKMKEKSYEKGYTFPYLIDEKQDVYKRFGATRTPHVFVLQKEDKDLVVKYIGTIDNNYKDAEAVTEKYVAGAVNSLLAGNNPEPDFTKAIGCTIKDRASANL